jgi:hypothetical protein
MTKNATNSNRRGVYSNHNANEVFGARAGPLRARTKLEESYGKCQGWCDKSRDEKLHGGLCSWCLWMMNDREANEEWD